MTYIVLLLGVFLNALASLFLKETTNQVGEFSFKAGALVHAGMKVALVPYFWLGMTCYAISVVLWVMVLSRLPVSIAYPMVSIGYVMNAILAYYWLGEDLSLTRILGITIICAGVVLVARS